MILWNRDRPYSTKLTTDEREEIAKAISTPDTIKFANRLNTILNALAIFTALIVFKFTQYNFIVFIIAFILTDAMLLLVDHMFFIVIPHWQTMHLSLGDAQKRLEEVKQRHSYVVSEIDKYKKEHCSKCYRSCSACYKTLVEWETVLESFIFDEERWINQELDKIKEREIQENKKQSKDYSDKREYLVAIQEKMEYYVSKHNVVILIPVLESVNLLVDTVDNKPIGCGLISNTLYIYLDELQSIVDKLIGLDSEQQSEYINDVSKIAVALSDNINRLIERINNLETQDIEVGIAVLLQELTGKKESNSNSMTNDRKEEEDV